MDAPKGGKRGYSHLTPFLLQLCKMDFSLSVSALSFPTAINDLSYDIYFIIGGLTFLLHFYLKTLEYQGGHHNKLDIQIQL